MRTARAFRVWEGGGEYNVARGLRRASGCAPRSSPRSPTTTSDDCSRISILQGGVDTSLVHWVPYDGIGRSVRNGLNFTERGFGVRGALGVSDRGHSAASQLAPGRGRLGPSVRRRSARAGCTRAGSSPRSPRPRPTWSRKRSRAAARHGTVSPTTSTTGPACGRRHGGARARARGQPRLAAHVDVMIGNEEDFTRLSRPRGRGRRRRLPRARHRLRFAR